MRYEQLIEEMFRRQGAVLAAVNVDGIATHWRTRHDAIQAKARMEEWGMFDILELFPDGGLYALFGRFKKRLTPESIRASNRWNEIAPGR